MENKKRLPNNIRQIGNPEQRIKVYAEDYVNIFFKKMQYRENDCIAGVLVGVQEIRENIPCLFISGAVESSLAVGRQGRLCFNPETWKEVLDTVRLYFPGLGICGWFVYEKTGCSIDRVALRRVHEQEFIHGNKVLLLHDDYDEEDFYMLEGGSFRRLKGYYIYYEKNEAMRSYMTHRREKAGETEVQNILPEDDSAAEKFRSRLEKTSVSYKKEKKSDVGGLLKTACLWAIVILLGVYVFNQYGAEQILEIFNDLT